MGVALDMIERMERCAAPTPADPAASGGRREAVFVAADLAADVAGGQALVDGAPAGAEVVVLDGAADGLAQMVRWARTRSGFDAVHILSHGEDGAILLGGPRLDRAAVAARRSELAELGAALGGGDLLVYGCNVARGDAGAAFVAALAEATGANVAASTTSVGPAHLGGRWDLDYRLGAVGTSVAFEAVRERLPYVLATLTVNTGAAVSASNFHTVQAAVAAAADGDTVSILPGSYREQVIVRTAITLEAANGAGTVTLEAPDMAALVNSSQNTVHNKIRVPVLDLRTQTEGQGTVTVRNLTIDGRFEGRDITLYPHDNGDEHMLGIGVYNTNANISNVTIKGIAAPLDSDSNYSGYSENHGILAEGSSTGPQVTVSITNSTIDTFQKTGIISWGPTLHMDISGNTITAAGSRGLSNQNAIQVGSSAGNGRGGTTATISNNEIYNIGSNDPVYGSTAIIIRQAGIVDIDGNLIYTEGAVGASGSAGVSLYEQSTGVTVRNNIFTNLYTAIYAESPLGTAYNGAYTISGNDFSKSVVAVLDSQVDSASWVVNPFLAENASTITVNSSAAVNNGKGYLEYQLYGGDDRLTDTGAAPSIVYGGAGNDTLATGSGADTLSGGAGADTLSGGGGNDVFVYAATGDGVDTIADFANGDRIRVTGRASTAGTVTVGTGTTVAANSVQIAASGGVTTLHIDTEGDADAAELTITLSGTYGVSDFVLNGTDILGNIPVVTPPAPQDDTPPTTTRTVDGVVVRETTQTATDGTVTQTLEVPIVTTGRREENAATSNADIPLARDGGTGQPVLEAHLPVGVGLTVEATGTTTGSGLEGLIRAIRNRTQDQPGDQTAMTGVGQTFLDVLPPATDLTVRTIIPVVADPTTPPSAPIVITGTPTVPATGGGGSASTQQQAIVIDVRNLPRGTVIQLQNVEFAAIVGDVQVTGGEGSQVVVGDSGNQIIVLGADDDTLRGGGGNDFVGSEGGDDVLWGDEGYDTVTGGIGNDVLYGNQQDDLVYGNQGTDTIFGGQDRDTVFGGQDGDVLYGNRADDVLYGQLGDDTLFGGQSNDMVWGGQGNDVLAGNLGADTLYGGLGADVFRINAVQEGGDLIADFEAGVDTLMLFSPNFPGVGGGALPAQHFALDNPTSTNATFVFNTRTGVLSFDADGSGAGAAVTLATLNVRTLSAGDIVLLGPGG